MAKSSSQRKGQVAMKSLIRQLNVTTGVTAPSPSPPPLLSQDNNNRDKSEAGSAGVASVGTSNTNRTPNLGSHLYQHSESAGSCATGSTTSSTIGEEHHNYNHDNSHIENSIFNNNESSSSVIANNSFCSSLLNNNHNNNNQTTATMVCDTQNPVELSTDLHHHGHAHTHVSHSSSQGVPLQEQHADLGMLSAAAMEESSSSIMMDEADDEDQHEHDTKTQQGGAGTDFLANLPLFNNNDGQGLANIDHDILEQYLTPVMKALEAMDAEAVLELKRTTNKVAGAKLKEGVYVEPIHDLVKPPPSMLYQQHGNQKHDCVRYLHVAEIPDKYSIGVFVFPPHAKIPLHDHPGMCVLSRVLYGSLQRLSLDLQRPEASEAEEQLLLQQQDSSSAHAPPSSSRSWFQSFFRKQSSFLRSKFNLPRGSRHATKNGSDVLEAPNCTMLFPFEGNLHEFIAGPQGAAVLDVLLPPYNLNEDRDCTFYTIHEDESNSAQASGDFNNGQQQKMSCWVVPTNQPESFHCLSGHYGDLGADDDDNDDAHNGEDESDFEFDE